MTESVKTHKLVLLLNDEEVDCLDDILHIALNESTYKGTQDLAKDILLAIDILYEEKP